MKTEADDGRQKGTPKEDVRRLPVGEDNEDGKRLVVRNGKARERFRAEFDGVKFKD